MEIVIPPLPTTQTVQSPIKEGFGVPTDFRVGQILQALAKGHTADGLIKLQIGGAEVLAQSRQPLSPGQALTLRVESTDPIPQLKVLDALTPSAIRTEALRQVLPRMLALAPALEKVLSPPTGGSVDALPQPACNALQALATQLPTAQAALSAQGLRGVIQLSGLFPEARLLQEKKPIADVKTALQRVANQLRNFTPIPTRAQAPAPRGPAPPPGARPSPGTADPPAAPARDEGAASSTGQPARGSSRPGPQVPPTMPTPARGNTAEAHTTAKPPSAAPNAKPGGEPPAPPASRGDAQPDAKPGSQNPPGAARPDAGGSPKAPLPGGRENPQAPPANVRAMPATSTATTTTTAAATSGQTPSAGTSSAPGQTGQPPPTAQGPGLASETAPELPLSIRRHAEGESAPRQNSPAPDPASGRLVQELTRQVEGALARIQYNQLQSLPQDDPSRQAWQLDLALRNGESFDGFQLRIEEERSPKQGSGEGSTWTVTLDFELAPLGPVQARVGVQGERVSSTFWAEKPETAALIQRRLDELRQGFQRAGLEVGKLAAHRGRAATSSPKSDGPLLDESV